MTARDPPTRHTQTPDPEESEEGSPPLTSTPSKQRSVRLTQLSQGGAHFNTCCFLLQVGFMLECGSSVQNDDDEQPEETASSNGSGET